MGYKISLFTYRVSQTTISTRTQSMVHAKKILLLITLAITSNAVNAHSNELIEPTKPNSISIVDNPWLERFKTELIKMIEIRYSKLIGEHHFYITKYDEKYKTVFMFWRKTKLLLKFYVGNNNEDSWDWLNRPKILHVENDVVPTQDQIGTSTYLVEQAWMNQKIFDTVVTGDLITIKYQ